MKVKQFKIKKRLKVNDSRQTQLMVKIDFRNKLG